jgi:cytochrome d ubiquinol oxidase subunit II
MDMLALTWAGIIAFGIILYVILGGFDIGIGILSIFIKNEHEKDIMVSTILPVWDGNQTWLVFGGAALYGAFPAAFSAILPIMYIPILVMVVALLFRGIAFEFRLKAIKTKKLWNICFFAGSLFATIAQGFILGSFVKGFSILDINGVSNSYAWFNPFAIICALGLIVGYALLGSNYLIIKTEGLLQKKCFKISAYLQFIIIIFFIIVSIWSPFLDEDIKQRWFALQNMPFLAILPLITLSLFIMHFYALKAKHEHRPFWCVIGMFLMCYIGFIISIYPYIVPRHLTYIDAAADKSSLLFMLIGACIMLPPLLFYTFHAYKIFSGKVTKVLEY